MKLRRGVLIRWLAIGAVAITYAVLAHLTNASPGSGELGVVLGVGPLAAIALTLVWRAGHRAAAVVLGALTALALFRYWPVLAQHVPWLYLLQQAGAYGLLAAAFGRSLAGSHLLLAQPLTRCSLPRHVCRTAPLNPKGILYQEPNTSSL